MRPGGADRSTHLCRAAGNGPPPPHARRPDVVGLSRPPASGLRTRALRRVAIGRYTVQWLDAQIV